MHWYLGKCHRKNLVEGAKRYEPNSTSVIAEDPAQTKVGRKRQEKRNVRERRAVKLKRERAEVKANARRKLEVATVVRKSIIYFMSLYEYLDKKIM